jgi:hypothetical protein
VSMVCETLAITAICSRAALSSTHRRSADFPGGDLAESTIARVWDKARKVALTSEEYASGLAKRRYDLRHTCVFA